MQLENLVIVDNLANAVRTGARQMNLFIDGTVAHFHRGPGLRLSTDTLLVLDEASGVVTCADPARVRWGPADEAPVNTAAVQRLALAALAAVGPGELVDRGAMVPGHVYAERMRVDPDLDQIHPLRLCVGIGQVCTLLVDHVGPQRWRVPPPGPVVVSLGKVDQRVRLHLHGLMKVSGGVLTDRFAPEQAPAARWRDLGAFADPASLPTGLLIETADRWVNLGPPVSGEQLEATRRLMGTGEEIWEET